MGRPSPRAWGPGAEFRGAAYPAPGLWPATHRHHGDMLASSPASWSKARGCRAPRLCVPLAAAVARRIDVREAARPPIRPVCGSHGAAELARAPSSASLDSPRLVSPTLSLSRSLFLSVAPTVLSLLSDPWAPRAPRTRGLGPRPRSPGPPAWDCRLVCTVCGEGENFLCQCRCCRSYPAPLWVS